MGDELPRQADLPQQGGKLAGGGRVPSLGLDDEPGERDADAAHAEGPVEAGLYRVRASQAISERREKAASQGWAVRVTPSTLFSVAEMDPMITLDFMSTGMRAASFVTHTRILPSFRKRPLNGMIARMRRVSNSPRGPLIRSVPSIFSSSR